MTRPAPTNCSFLDITASHENRGIILDVVRRTAEACFMPLTVGGGVRTIDDIRALLRPAPTRSPSTPRPSAAAPSSRRRRRNSATNASWWRSTPRRCRRPASPERWEIFTHGGRKPTGLDAVDYAREVVALGAGEILLTSMDRDGTRQGFDMALTRAVADAVPVPVIASGGVGNLDHLVAGVRDGHAAAVLAASIFHFGEYTRPRRQGLHGGGRPCRCGSIRDGCVIGRMLRAPCLSGAGGNDNEAALWKTSRSTILSAVSTSAPLPTPTCPIPASCSIAASRNAPRSSARRRSSWRSLPSSRAASGLIEESADLIYHLLVVLKARDIKLAEVEAVLGARASQSGLAEKAGRKGS